MLSVTENKSTFSDQDLVQMVRRENNPKRNFLLVNSKQGKHIPADPHDVMILFSQLAGCIKDVVSDEKVLFIGFAETATAVGTGVASCFENACYVHTTREKYISEKYLVAEFSEEHSHAVEQLLFFKNWEETAAELDRIVFVEDEISTGKTIENFVKVLKKDRFLSPDIKFSACSILNGMSDERKNELLSENLDFYLTISETERIIIHHAPYSFSDHYGNRLLERGNCFRSIEKAFPQNEKRKKSGGPQNLP